MDGIFQLFSVIGAVFILAAYFNLQRGSWQSHDARYLWANFVGAAVLTIVAVVDRRVGFAMLEGTWAAATLWSIARGPWVSEQASSRI